MVESSELKHTASLPPKAEKNGPGALTEGPLCLDPGIMTLLGEVQVDVNVGATVDAAVNIAT